MAKIADSYFKVDPWNVIEEGFDPEYGKVAESVFSLGNEYMGVRGYFEEGYGGPTLLGSYFNGVYERHKAAAEGYKGIVQETEFMVNSIDWLYLRIWAGDEKLDLAKVKFDHFYRCLSLKTGLLCRKFLWHTARGTLEIQMERLISMVTNEAAAQRLIITSKGYNGEIRVSAGLDCNTVHGSEQTGRWDCSNQAMEKHRGHISCCTKNTKMKLDSYCAMQGTIVDTGATRAILGDKCVAEEYTLFIKDQESYSLDKIVWNVSPLSQKQGMDHADKAMRTLTFDSLYASNCKWWEKVWEKSDVEISGDEENQQGIRFCIFQMFQTYHGAIMGTNIGAKGLTGEAYNGNAFWDTETYCLPFFLFHDKQAAKNLLYFRYATLDEARARAKALDCEGAFYPIATISGRECCNLWQHASLQLQASTAVAYGIWIYEKVAQDTSFTEKYGLEMLIEICRMLATRGDYNADHTCYGFYGVMGPDEFQMMVNHNAYTNYMGQFSFRYTLDVLERMKKNMPEVYEEVIRRVNYKDCEGVDWKQKADKMYIPYDAERKLFEQHDGFFKLPHIDVDAIPIEEFPLYDHWTYDRIYRNDMIKQPDVLMFLLLFNSQFSEDVLRSNYEFYEPRCIHESSLSPSVHSILAAQLGKKEEAFDFFKFATRMDLDNYNRNSGDGLHITSIAAAWMNIVYGFGGLRADGESLTLAPSIPEQWDGYRFHVVYEDEILCVDVKKDGVSLSTAGGKEVEVCIYGQKAAINEKRQVFAIPA